MIRHFSILLFTLITLSLSAEGIDFQYNSIYAASKAARVEGKMIFVYANTSSCDLCRSMEQKGLKNAEVVSFYKAHFVSVQLDIVYSREADPLSGASCPPLGKTVKAY